MPAPALTMASKLFCPHGAPIVATPRNVKAGADTQMLLSADDVFQIAGCPFTLPNTTPSPCVQVEWFVPPNRATMDGARLITGTDLGICKAATQAPQGPVQIQGAPSKVMVP